MNIVVGMGYSSATLRAGVGIPCAALLADALGNPGMLAFGDALLAETTDTGQQPGTYSLFEALPKAEVESQMAAFRRATALDPNSPVLRWGLSRLALVAGDAATAAETLKPIVHQAEHNPCFARVP